MDLQSAFDQLRERYASPDWALHDALHLGFDAHFRGLYASLGEPLHVFVETFALERSLREHMDCEEREVLPIYRDRVPRPAPPGRIGRFLEDHQLIRQRLARLKEVAVLAAFDVVRPSQVADALANLDELMDHHDQREEEHLYGGLAPLLDPASRVGLMKAFAQRSFHLPIGQPREALLASPWFLWWRDRYAAWLAIRSGQSVDPEVFRPRPDDVPPPLQGPLEKLAARDERVIRAFETASGARERSHAALSADRTLRSTLDYLCDRTLPDTSIP